jgi:hypothetical protein
MRCNLRLSICARLNWMEDVYDQRNMGRPRSYFHNIPLG